VDPASTARLNRSDDCCPKTVYRFRTGDREPSRESGGCSIGCEKFRSRCGDEPVAEIVPNTQPIHRQRSKSLYQSEFPGSISIPPLLPRRERSGQGSGLTSTSPSPSATHSEVRIPGRSSRDSVRRGRASHELDASRTEGADGGASGEEGSSNEIVQEPPSTRPMAPLVGHAASGFRTCLASERPRRLQGTRPRARAVACSTRLSSPCDQLSRCTGSSGG
jgi:hypothetical protein